MGHIGNNHVERKGMNCQETAQVMFVLLLPFGLFMDLNQVTCKPEES
jgi:hypothetical protein